MAYTYTPAHVSGWGLQRLGQCSQTCGLSMCLQPSRSEQNCTGDLVGGFGQLATSRGCRLTKSETNSSSFPYFCRSALSSQRPETKQIVPERETRNAETRRCSGELSAGSIASVADATDLASLQQHSCPHSNYCCNAPGMN